MHRKFLCVLGAVLLTAIPLHGSQAGEETTSWLAPVQTLVETKPPPPEKGTVPNRLAMSPDGRWIAAACNQSNALVLYNHSFQDGTITWVGSIPKSARFKPVFSIDSRFIYVPSDKLQVYSLDDEGALNLIQEVANGKNGIVGMRLAPYSCISPDGHNFYVGTGDDRTLVCFSREPRTGQIRFLECLQDRTPSLPHPGTDFVLARLVPTARKTDGAAQVNSLHFNPDGSQLFVGTEYEGQRELGPLAI